MGERVNAFYSISQQKVEKRSMQKRKFSCESFQFQKNQQKTFHYGSSCTEDINTQTEREREQSTLLTIQRERSMYSISITERERVESVEKDWRRLLTDLLG